jgi:hypothetical protein
MIFNQILRRLFEDKGDIRQDRGDVAVKGLWKEIPLLFESRVSVL